MPYTVKNDNSNFVITDAESKYVDPNKQRYNESFHETQAITVHADMDVQMVRGQGGRYPVEQDNNGKLSCTP